MKNFLLNLSTAVLSVVSYSQPMQGQIFNFSVGDVFEMKTDGSIYPLYQLDTIVSKTVNGDSIHYTIHRNYLSNGPNPSMGQSVEYLNIDVTQPADFMPPIYSCAPTIDSVFTGSCGQTIWQRKTYFDTCSIEPPMWSAELMEGLGGEYYWYMDPSNLDPGFTIQHKLIYSNTEQWGECGSYYSWIVGISELDSIEKKVVKVVDLLGRQISEKPNTTLIYIYSDGTTEKVYRVE